MTDGGTTEYICIVAKGRAHTAATAGNCDEDGFGNRKIHGTQIGQVEPACDCQCADNVCICTSKLEVVCSSQE